MFSRKSSSHLYDRISAALTPQFKKCVDGREYDRLIIFAGNGLTRIAASGQKDDVSWTGWIKACLKDVKSDLRLEYLSALGYSLDQAFSFALDLAIEKGTPHPVALWRHLWNATQSLKPSPVHEALVQAADVIMTTNYDRLFEQTAAGSKKPQSLDMFAESAPRIARDRLTKLLIFKLHGSFPEEKRISMIGARPDLALPPTRKLTKIWRSNNQQRNSKIGSRRSSRNSRVRCKAKRPRCCFWERASGLKS